MPKKITDDQLNIIKKELTDSLLQDRHKLLMQQPFIGNVAMRFNLIPIRDIRCRTACTDYKNIYFDCDFYLQLSNSDRLFVLAHEIWHALFLHGIRKQFRIDKIFNLAADMEINNMLSNCFFTSPNFVFYPPDHLKNKSAEVIYDWLITLSKDDQLTYICQHNKKQFDKHIYDSDNSDDTDDNIKKHSDKIIDRWGEVGIDPDFSPKISKENIEKMREAAVSAAQAYQREHGDLPGYLEAFVGKLVKPQINWKDYLSQFVTSLYGNKRQWLPPNRRYVHNDMYFQSRRCEKIRLGVFIDTSGSTHNYINKFFSELKHLLDTFSNYEVHCIHCDADINHYELYDDMNPLYFNDNLTYFGGGGTNFDPPFDYIKENNIQIDAAIYFTDGYASCTIDKPTDYSVLWVITPNGSDTFCNWGKKIFFNDNIF